MANPQPDEFTRISNELYTAIMQTDFSKRQRNILDLVIRMSYGCGKKYALLRPIDFEVVGVYKTHVRKELDYLEQAKVLFIDGERISLNKDYDQWRVSLVKGASNEKFEAILRRNLNQEVTESVTKVTKLVTNNGNDGYQNSNQVVTKTVTEEGSKANNDAGLQRPKEIVKESTCNITPLESPQTFEEVLNRHPRYTRRQYDLIRKYWDMIRFTRKSGKVAVSVIAREMDYWERFSPEIVEQALTIHIQRYQTKPEEYTRGIMRRLHKERELKGGKHLGTNRRDSATSDISHLIIRADESVPDLQAEDPTGQSGIVRAGKIYAIQV